MSFWDGIERGLKVAGILGGVAAAVGVYIQLRDINNKDFQKKIEDWQSAAIYEVIEDSPPSISLRDIAPKYAAKANNFPEGVPRSTLDEPHIRVALIRLIQSQAVVELANGIYTATNQADPKELFITTFKMMNDASRLMATHTQLAFQVLSDSNGPLTDGQLSQRIIATGGDRLFLRDNLPILLQQMSIQGMLRFLPDGKVVVSNGIGGQNVLSTERVLPSPQLIDIIPKIDAEALKLIMTRNIGRQTTVCYHDKNPDVEERRPDGLTDRLKKLNIITVTEINGTKDDKGKPCSVFIQVDQTDLFDKLQAYYYQALLLTLKYKSDVK